MAEFAYINSKYSATGETSFYMMYGYYLSIHYVAGDGFLEKKILIASERIKQLQDYRQKIETHLRRAIEAQAKYYNKTHKPQVYKKKKLVILSTRNLKQKRFSKKLSHRFIGPFRIEAKVGAQAY